MQYPLVKIGVDEREMALEPTGGVDAQNNQLAQLFGIVLRRWLVIIPTAALIFAISFAVSMSAPRVYSATAKLMVDPTPDQVIAASQPVAGSDPNSSPVELEVELLNSPILMRRVVEKLGLANDPEFNADLRAGGGLLALLPWRKPPAPAAPKSPEAVRNAVAGGVGSAVAVRRRGRNGIDVTVESTNPERAALIVNTLIDLHFQHQVEVRIGSLDRASGWLTSRLEGLRNELRDKELAAETHRVSHGLSLAAGGEESTAQSSDVQSLMLNASADLAEREARLRQVDDLLREGRPADTIGSVLSSQIVSDLRLREAELRSREAELTLRYSDQHPTLISLRSEIQVVDQRIKDEIARISTNMRNEVDVARARLAELQGSFGDLAGTAGVDNAAVVKYRELLRDATAARAVYESFLQRSHEIEEQGSLPTVTTQLLAAAEPPGFPSRPSRNFALMMALCLASVGGIAVGFLVHVLDRSVASVAEIESRLGEHAVASVPRLRRSDYAKFRRRKMKRAPADYLVERPLSVFAEAIRILRTAIQRPGSGQSIRVVAVTSAVPNEGKTTMSLCLARAVAMSGQKVLLVDCDLRRSSLLAAAAVTAERGFTEVILDGADWKSAIVSDTSTKVDILPSGKLVQDADDLFSSEGARRLMNELRGAYDLIVLDCAPVLALAETRVVITHADAALLVMRSQKTPVNVVRTALRVVRSTNTELLGIVLNRVNLTLPGRSTDGDPLHYALSRPYYHS